MTSGLEMMVAPAQFLNLDLILKSSSELGAIIGHFEDKAFVLVHDEHNGEWTLTLELSVEELPESPHEYTRRFLAIISEFPDEVRDVWKACTSRTFSYGFEGGLNSPALDATIGADLLRRIAEIGADIGITVYPFKSVVTLLAPVST